MNDSVFSKNKTLPVMLYIVILLGSLYQGVWPRGESIAIDKRSSLADLMLFAASNNPGLKAAFYQWKALLENVPQVRSLPDPRLTFAHFIREVETRVGPQKNRVGIMQMFPWFGILKLKGEAALEKANSERQKVDQIKFNLFFRLKKRYYQYYYVFQNISILDKNIELLTYMEKVIEAKYRAGSAGYVDLIKIQIERDKLSDRLRSAREIIVPLQIKLNALLNREPNAPLPLPRYRHVSSAVYSKNQLIEWLKESNPELKSLDFSREKAQTEIKLARKGYFPDFTVGLDYIMTDEAIMTGVEDSGKDPIVAMVQVSIPLWFSKNRARVNQAKFNLERVLNQKKEKENSLLANMEMVFYKFRDEDKKLKLYRENLLPQARQAIEVVLSAYKTGKTDILNFMDSQRTLLDLELKHEYLLSTYAQRQAELEMLVGKTLF